MHELLGLQARLADEGVADGGFPDERRDVIEGNTVYVAADSVRVGT